MDTEDNLTRLRDLCMAMPEATERLSHGAPSWFVRGKKLFVSYTANHHDQRLSFWCAAPPGETAAMVAAEPEKYYVPPYVGHRGWLGAYLDIEVNWNEVAEIVEDAYRCVAPKRLVTELDERT